MRAFNAQNLPPTGLAFDFASLDLSKPIDLEIGAGQGMHAIRYCKAHPERILLAVERTHVRFHGLEQRRQAHAQLQNLLPLHADAVNFVHHHIPEDALQRIFLLYPNPYPKPKQANLRWYNRPFLSTLLNKLAPQGELILATNLEWYAREALARLQVTWGMNPIEFAPIPPTVEPRTHFEKKYLERGETCWHLRMRKFDPSPLPYAPSES